MKPAAEIETLIMTFLTSHLSAAEEGPAADSNLIAEGYLDSVGLMRLIHHLESSLDIKIPPHDLVPRNFLSVKAMVSYLNSGSLLSRRAVP